MRTFTQTLEDLDHRWKFQQSEGDTYAFFADGKCVAVSTLNLHAAVSTLADLVDADDIEKVSVKLMPKTDALSALFPDDNTLGARPMADASSGSENAAPADYRGLDEREPGREI